MRNLLKVTTIFILSVILFSVVAEVYLRFKCSFCTWSESNQGEFISPFNASGCRKLHILGPDSTTQYNQPEFNFEIITNSEGIRDIEHPVKKPAGEVRILGLGDSFVEGQGAPFEAIWLKVLEGSLRKKFPGTGIQTIVGGVRGSDPIFSHRLLRERLLKYAPDLIIHAVNRSDVEDLMVRGGEERFLTVDGVRFADPPKMEWFAAKSRLLRLVLIEFFGYNFFYMGPREAQEKTAQAIEKMASIIGKTGRLSSEKGARYLLVFIPHEWELSKGRYEYGWDRIGYSLREKNIEVLDLMEPLKAAMRLEKNSLRKYFWAKDAHPTPEGYRIIAIAIENHILKSEYWRIFLKENGSGD